MVKNVILFGVLCSMLYAETDPVILSGIVKDPNDTRIEGVNLRLSALSNLTAVTDADGAFSIDNTSSVRLPSQHSPSIEIYLKGNRIIFTSAANTSTGHTSLLSCNGKEIITSSFTTLHTGKQRLVLPSISSGIYILQITLDGKSCSRSLVSIGNDLFFSNKIGKPLHSTSFTLAKQAAKEAVDTLIAEKSGYTPSKYPLSSYTQSDIEITLQGECTREILQALVNEYIEALKAADPSMMNLADDAEYIENMRSSEFGEGVWTTALNVGFHRDFFDTVDCTIFTEVMDYQSNDPTEIGAQITVEQITLEQGKIAKIDALVSHIGDWLLDSKADFEFRHEISNAENWDIIPVEDRDERETIQYAGDAYLDCFLDSTVVDVPWGIPCARLEGGGYTGGQDPDNPYATCNVGVPQGLEITDRTYVIDADMGTVSILCKFGGGMPDSHLFRVLNGKLRFVHTISINQ